MTTFAERAEEMGLAVRPGGVFYYQDVHSEIIYRTLLTENETLDMKGNTRIPKLAIFTRKTSDQEWKYTGVISDDYRFEGNEKINQNVRANITQVGSPILEEITEFSSDLCQMRNNIILNNPSNINEVGNIYPQVSVINSYNGTLGSTVSFGIHIPENTNGVKVNFNFKKFGTISQVHHRSHVAHLVSPISSYIQSFSGNISQIISSNFNNQLADEDILKTLDLIEKIGVKTRRSVESVLSESRDTDQPISSWQMFLVIARFTATTKSLNIKRMIENVAERVLVIPSQLRTMVQETNQQISI